MGHAGMQKCEELFNLCGMLFWGVFFGFPLGDSALSSVKCGKKGLVASPLTSWKTTPSCLQGQEVTCRRLRGQGPKSPSGLCLLISLIKGELRSECILQRKKILVKFLRPGALSPQIFRLTPLMTTLKSKWGESVLWALLPLGPGEFWKERGLCLQVKGQEVQDFCRVW